MAKVFPRRDERPLAQCERFQRMPKTMSYLPGSVIYFSGDVDDRVFILQRGQVSIKTVDIKTGAEHADTIKPGEFIGLSSALGHFPREETVSAVSAVSCVVMGVPELEPLFGRNKPLVMKMLRVFSNQLRSIHKEIESSLSKGEIVDQETGLFSVAKAFYDDKSWRSCLDVCRIFAEKFPGSKSRVEALRMEKSAEAHFKKEAKAGGDDGFGADGGLDIDDMFSLPAFERFAKVYEDGQVIISEFQNGDSFYFIQRGEVELVKCANGMNKTLDILKPGEIFGEMAILDNSPRSATCVASGKVKCLEFNKDNFEAIVTGNPQIAITLLRLFCKRVHDQRRRFRILLLPDVYSKVADVFCMFDEMASRSSADGQCELALTISDVANWAGVSFDATSDEINKFSMSGKIRVFDDRIVVNNIADMRRIVELRSTIMKR